MHRLTHIAAYISLFCWYSIFKWYSR